MGALGNVGRTVRTARHLRLSQLFWRARYWAGKRFPVNSAAPADGIHLTDAFPDVPCLGRATARGGELVRQLTDGRLCLLHHTGELGVDRPDWRLGPQRRQRLWCITLHYHEWVYALAEVIAVGGDDALQAERLLLHYLNDWLRRCDLRCTGSRHLAWNAYAASTRIAWWIRCYRLLGRTWWGRHAEFEREFLTSLWRQADFVHRHLEWDLRANHLLRDAVGLAWAGRFLSGKAPERWLRTATRLAARQVEEQVLADGGHFERSPMYHIHVMEDLVSLDRLLTDADARQRIQQALGRMAEFLRWCRQPDGDIPLLNDASGNARADLVQLAAAIEPGAVELSRPCGGRWFRDTGLVVWHGSPWSVFFDAGAIGPDFQPGHAHADTLNLVCSYAGQRLFDDPGTFGYDRDDRRRYDRSTAAHNTVCIDGMDSSEVWHIFRVGSRARPVDVSARFDDRTLEAQASHTGYDRLPGRPRHVRHVRVGDGSGLEITDRVEGQGEHTVEGGLLVAPGWSVHPEASGWTLTNQEHRLHVMLRHPAGVDLTVEPRPYHPEFGREIETPRLTWRRQGRLPVEVVWAISGQGKLA